MTDISIDDMIDARQQAQPGFKKAYRARGYTTQWGNKYTDQSTDRDEEFDYSRVGGIGSQKDYADKYDASLYFDHIAPPTEEPLSEDPKVREGQLAQAAYFNTFGLQDIDKYFDAAHEDELREGRSGDPPNIDAARRAKGTAMDVKGDLRYGALGNDHPEVRLKLAEDDNRKRAMEELAAEANLTGANLTDGEDYGSREADPDDEMDFEDEDDDIPTLKEVGPASDNGQTPSEPQKKRSSKDPKKKRIPPSKMDKEKMADRATKFNDRHIFKSEGTDIDSLIYGNQFEKGGQPLTDFKGRNEIAEDAANKYFDDSWPKVISERSYVNKWNKTLDDPKTAIQAWKNKQEAIDQDEYWDELSGSDEGRKHDENIPMNQIGAKKIKASDLEGEKTESEEEITEDEVKEADTPEDKEDVRVGTEEAAAREDKAKAIEALGKAKEDEEKAAETAYTFDKIPEDPAERAKWEKAMGYDWESMLEGWGIEPTPEIVEEFESAAHPGAYPNIDDLIMRYQRRE